MAMEPLSQADLPLLKGKAVLITGGASGIGRDTAILFAQAGAYVTIADIQAGDALVKELTTSGYKAQYIHCDVTNWESQDAAFKAAISFSSSKTLDIVAAFAGVDQQGHLVDHIKTTAVAPSLDSPTPAPPSTREITVNTIGTVYTATLTLHYSRLSTNTTSLIIVSSLAGYVDDTHDTVYTSSKFGSRGLFRAIRARAREELDVRVNVVAPWAMKTPMTAPILEQMEQHGIEEGKGITFVKSEVLTNAMARIATDKGVYGRAFSIMPEGAFDVGDDIEGGYGGPELQRLMELRKKAGDYVTG